ncbi:histidine phosphatase family protein [Streptomyces albireticuli]|nr:histidine phosphatase family protein [Streptomyces albireticuli]MCD9141045.1 histidine phosphatase family protein [Streptomyces albireticuli]MCD9160993.1 histidine phosphatase family protein [Streptomyces albireticuli]MCD9190949.1 histidine phosphatase family protein [Streptomyces albireticuli]
MTVRVTLISAVAGVAAREARFGDGPPDEAALRRAAEAAGGLPAASRVFSAPSARCRATCAALGVTPDGAAPYDLDPGRWRGRSLAEVGAEEPGAVARWLSDPAAAPPGGESVLDVVARVGGWLDSLVEEGGRVLAVVEPAVVRAAVVHGLGLPAGAFWRLDVRPLVRTELSGRAGRWNLRCGSPL